MNGRAIPFWPFGINRTPAAPTPSESARILRAASAQIQKAKRTAMLCELRREVLECDITPLGWKS